MIRSWELAQLPSPQFPAGGTVLASRSTSTTYPMHAVAFRRKRISCCHARNWRFATHAERPWLGYLMMLENCSRSTATESVRQPHFPVFPEFLDASYAQRYRLLLTKLVRERLYDSACFLMSSSETGPKGRYTHADPEQTFMQLAASLSGKITSHLNANLGRTRA